MRHAFGLMRDPRSFPLRSRLDSQLEVLSNLLRCHVNIMVRHHNCQL